MVGHITEPGPRLQYTIRHQTPPLKNSITHFNALCPKHSRDWHLQKPNCLSFGFDHIWLAMTSYPKVLDHRLVPQVANSPIKHSTGPQEKVVAPCGMQLGDVTDFQPPCTYQVAICFPVFPPSLRALRSQRLSYPASTGNCKLSLHQVQVKGPRVLSSKAEGTGTAG